MEGNQVQVAHENLSLSLNSIFILFMWFRTGAGGGGFNGRFGPLPPPPPPLPPPPPPLPPLSPPPDIAGGGLVLKRRGLKGGGGSPPFKPCGAHDGRQWWGYGSGGSRFLTPNQYSITQNLVQWNNVARFSCFIFSRIARRCSRLK